MILDKSLAHVGPHLTNVLVFSLMGSKFHRLKHILTPACILGNLFARLSRRNLVSGLPRVGTLEWQFGISSVTQLLCAVSVG